MATPRLAIWQPKESPEICAKLFCYCGCDSTDQHISLLDCFTSDHGVDCSICQEEAIMALQMHDQGKSLAEIQKKVDQKYVSDYNSIFETPSQTLLDYRKQRLWKPTSAESKIENSVGKTKEQKAGVAAEGSKTKSAAGAASKKSGSCCGHAH